MNEKKEKVSVLIAVAAVVLALCVTASADPYCGGLPLTTASEGTVSGDLWFDHSCPMVQDWTKDFTLPSYTDVQRAHLYVAIYCGNMQKNCPGRANITFNGVQLGGTADGLSSEEFDVCYTYPGLEYTEPCAPSAMGYNDAPGYGTGTEWINDHCVRVTSDYLMWYDVTGLVEPDSNVSVTAWRKYPEHWFDGRVVVVTLVVAYNDGDSDTVHYWINRGHDVDNYYWDNQGGPNYIGETNFTADLPPGSTIQNSNLTVVHKASTDGAYTFNGVGIPTDPDGSTTPPGVNWQGPYSGYNIWYVSSMLNSNSNNTLTYDRDGSFYKIMLGFLSANYTAPAGPVADFYANVTDGVAPLAVQFNDMSTGDITNWTWDFDNNGVIDSEEQNPDHVYTDPGIYTVRLNVTGPGGNDEEIKVDYITVTERIPATPFQIYGWVNDSEEAPVNDPDVNVTNLNTSEIYAVETNASFNYYQVLTCSENVSAGDVLHFTAIAETTKEFDYTVKVADMNRGGFEQNITIEANPYPDMVITAINAYHYNTGCMPWFNMTNEVDVTVKNTGDVNATGAFNVSVTTDDEYYAKQNVPGGLNVGESVTLTFTGWTPVGEDCFINCACTDTCHDYTITGVADCDNDVEERYEENNATTISGEDGRVCYNGYMADEPLENVAHGILRGCLNFTTGNGTYGGLYNVNEPIATEYAITIPAGASLKLAKLNVYYTWHYEASCPQMQVSITNETGPHVLDLETRYNDMKCQKSTAAWRYPWGNYVYNVTEYITGTGTYTVSVERTGGSSVCIAAPGIVYVYEDDNEPTIEYWINEGADVLIGGRRGDGGYLAWWECINNATFPTSTGTGVVANATLGVVAPWGDDITDDIMFFNDIELGRGVYSGYTNTVDETIDGMSMYIGSTNAQVGVNMTDVTAHYLNDSENMVSQADDGDNMMPCNAFLVVEYTEEEKEKDDVAIAEATVKGEVIAGNFTSTHVSDNEYEAIKETLQGPRSVLEHEWTINVTGGSKTNVTFYVEANRTRAGTTDSDNFTFEYSTGGNTYEPLVIVNTSVEMNYSCEMPTDTSGNVTIRVKDTDRIKGHKDLDTIYIDHMFIRSVFATPSYGVSVTIDEASQKVAPGNSTNYTVTVTNTGDFNASYSVVMSGTAVNESNNITVNPLNWNTGILELTKEYVQIVTVYTDASTPEETYTLTATTTCDNDTNVADSDTSDLVVSSADYTDDKAIAEATVKGNVIGDYTDTYMSDNKSEAIEEVLSSGNPAKKYSLLEHEWTINVTSGSKINVTFYLEANRTNNTEGDDFKFEYSTDGSTYYQLVTVNEPVDTVYSCKMSNETSGNVTIRVTDTNRKSGYQNPDTVYIDHMYIRSVFGTPEPGVMHVDSITMWNTSKGPNYKIYTQVTIVDANNKSVSNATVELNTTSPSNNTESFSGATGVDGSVTFMYGPTKEKGEYISMVTNVTKTGGWEYNQSANVMTNKTHTVN